MYNEGRKALDVAQKAIPLHTSGVHAMNLLGYIYPRPRSSFGQPELVGSLNFRSRKQLGSRPIFGPGDVWGPLAA